MVKKANKKERFFDKNLKRLAKKANRRLRELEAKKYKSPAYKAVQAQLEMMGVRKRSAKGRRFSESGKAIDQNDLRQQLSVINRFLSAKTSTRTGYEEYREEIYKSANEIYKLSDFGISQEKYEEIFDALPDEIADRMYYAEYYIQVTEAYQVKIKEQIEKISNDTNRSEAQKKAEIEVLNENKLDIKEIIDIMESSEDYKKALSKIGLNIKDVNKIKKLQQEKKVAKK